jgi:hypothetical protein
LIGQRVSTFAGSMPKVGRGVGVVDSLEPVQADR